MPEATDKQLKAFVKRVMDIERNYANEHKHAKSNRQTEVKEYMEKFAAKELDDEDKQNKA